MKEEIIKIAKEAAIRMDLKKTKNDLIDRVAEPMLKKAVEESANPIAKIVMKVVYDSLEDGIKKVLDKEIDKLLK